MASSKLNYDVVCNILSFVAHFQDNASLFSCALVSRLFCAPALDHLWHTQDSLGTLVMHTLPTDSWQIRDDYWIHLTRDITPADIQRLLIYSPRIRHISTAHGSIAPSSRDWHPHWSILLALSSCAPVHLLPNITHLHAPLISRIERSNAFIPFIETLVTRRLVELSIELPEADDTDAVLRPLLSMCPRLRRLAITSPCPTQLSSSISHLSDLRSFVTDNHTVIHPDALLYLSTLDELEDVTFRLARGVQVDLRSKAVSCRRFPSIKNISLTCDSLATASEVFDNISSPTVESIQTTCASVLPEHLQQLFTALSENTPWRTSLQTLEVSTITEQDSPTDVISSTWLTVLFSFTKLRTLILDRVGIFDLDDTDANALAEAWQSIESLRLVSSPAQDRPSRVSWMGTFAFCNNCPNIRDLHLSYDTVIASAPPKMPKAVVRAHK